MLLPSLKLTFLELMISLFKFATVRLQYRRVDKESATDFNVNTSICRRVVLCIFAVDIAAVVWEDGFDIVWVQVIFGLCNFHVFNQTHFQAWKPSNAFYFKILLSIFLILRQLLSLYTKTAISVELLSEVRGNTINVRSELMRTDLIPYRERRSKPRYYLFSEVPSHSFNECEL